MTGGVVVMGLIAGVLACGINTQQQYNSSDAIDPDVVDHGLSEVFVSPIQQFILDPSAMNTSRLVH